MENDNPASIEEDVITNPETGAVVPAEEESKEDKKYSDSDMQKAIRDRLSKSSQEKAALAAENEALKTYQAQVAQEMEQMRMNQSTPEEMAHFIEATQKNSYNRVQEEAKAIVAQQNLQVLGNKLEAAAKEDPEFNNLVQTQLSNPTMPNVMRTLAEMNYIPNVAAVTKYLFENEADADIARSSTPGELKKFIKEISEKLGAKKPDASGYEINPIVQGSSTSNELDAMSYLKKKGRR